jgi:hypothetical protein
MKTIALTFLLLFAIQFAPAQDRSAKRNLSSYENGGEYKLEWNISDTRRAAEADKVREFIWTHWKNKRLGFIKLTLFNNIGDRYQTTFFTETDSSNKWVISYDVWGSQKNTGAPVTTKRKTPGGRTQPVFRSRKNANRKHITSA